MVDACCYVLGTGCARRLLPLSFAPWQAVYKVGGDDAHCRGGAFGACAPETCSCVNSWEIRQALSGESAKKERVHLLQVLTAEPSTESPRKLQ